MPARRKAPGSRQDNRPGRRAELTVVPIDAAKHKPPPPPPDLLPESERAWRAYWDSDIVSANSGVDVILVERWVMAYDEWHRATAAVRKNRLVDGSQGQPVLNPLASWAQSREAVMKACEAELGIGPKSRSALGISIGQHKLTAAELNRMTQGPGHGDTEVLDVDDEDEEAAVLDGFEEAE